MHINNAILILNDDIIYIIGKFVSSAVIQSKILWFAVILLYKSVAYIRLYVGLMIYMKPLDI